MSSHADSDGRQQRTTYERRYGERADRPRRLRAQTFAALTLATGSAYLVWVGFALNPEHPVVSGLFFVSEACCLALFATATSTLWRLRFKPQESPAPDRPYSVDVLIPVCGEPLAVISKTLCAVARIRSTGPLSVYVLDDAAAPEVEELSRELGFRYLSREGDGLPREDAKAGNLNFGFARSRGELVLVLDADQVPQPGILEAMVGYMRFPRCAFVQSMQDYLVPEGDPFFNQDRVFYGTVQKAMDDSDTVIACGSGVLYRRTALEDIGGFVTWNLVEDLTTSYHLHARGWKSFYYPYPLTRGLAPDTIWGVYRQRGQWALDTMRIFFWDNPLLKRGLTIRRRLSYLLIGFSYFCSGIVVPYLFTIPVWVYLTGGSVTTRAEIPFVVIRGLYFVAMAAAMHFMAYPEKAGRQFQMLVGIFPVYLLNTLRALRYRKSKPLYHVNNRVRREARRPLPAVLAVLPQAVLVGANLLLPLYAICFGVVPARVVAANALVSAVAVWTLWSALDAALGPHRWELGRHPMQFYGLPEAR